MNISPSDDNIDSTAKPFYANVMYLSLLLSVATAAVYWQLCQNDFIIFDDATYLLDNKAVQKGLGFANIIWAFTSTTYASNWHPLTWLSHMIDWQIFGANPSGHHLVNLLFHIANSIVLLRLLNRLTGSLWKSALVAGLFALHPLHVESVAWAAERKDVLSTLFGLLSLSWYVSFARLGRLRDYWVALLLFLASLMAKPMLVTLPFVLLMLDCWPLGRFAAGTNPGTGAETPMVPQKSVASLLAEKIPFLAATLICCLLTSNAQQKSAMASMEMFPLLPRLANAAMAYVSYIQKMFWPVNLSVIYPLPTSISLQRSVICFAIIVVLTVAVIAQRKSRPYLSFGWFWFLGTLVPTIGLVQVGYQSMADRYTYVPLTGLFIMIVWGAAELVERCALPRIVPATLAIVVLTALSATAYVQVGYWKNSSTLFTHALDVTKNNYFAHYMLGGQYARQGADSEALLEYQRALKINPYFLYAYLSSSDIYMKHAKFDDAAQFLNAALRIAPSSEEARKSLDVCIKNVRTPAGQ
jgi:protein O-mannosyl-transferase